MEKSFDTKIALLIALAVAVIVIGALVFTDTKSNNSDIPLSVTGAPTPQVTGSRAAAETVASPIQPTPPPVKNDASATNQLSLQSKCADYAHNYFVQNDYKVSDGFSYQNHYSAKLQKCFILISSGPNFSTSPDGNVGIDVYDAIEGKHYAEFNGWSLCNATDGNCQVSQGDIWYDGNDQRNPPDIREGFGGLKYGGTGDENTESKFLDDVQYFMAN